MTSAVALIFVLFVSKVERSDAVFCYTCEYKSFEPEKATCSEPFSAANAPTCDGPACYFRYDMISGQQNDYAVNRDCSGIGLSQCQPYMYTAISDLGNLTYFPYGSSCCLSIITIFETQSISCQCQTDNCNGDLPHRIPKAGDLQSTTANRISTQSTIANRISTQSTIANRISTQSTIARRKSSAGFSTQPITKLSTVFVAIIAVLSIISWYNI